MEKKQVLSGLFFLLGLGLFLSLSSINYELNGVLEAENLEAGDLFTPNHMLYRPMGLLVYRGLQIYAQYDGVSLFVLQVITAIFASLGLAFSFLAFAQISQSIIRAALVTVGMGISWSYWRFSTNAAYLPVAMPFIALAIFSFLQTLSGSKRAGYYAVISGVACAGAILVWQANIFLLLVLGLGYLILYEPTTAPKRVVLTSLLTFVPAVLIVGLVYVSVGIIVFEVRTLTDFLTWVSGHPGLGLSAWGRWGLDRFPTLLHTHASSIIPVWDGLGLRDLLRGEVNPAKISGQVSFVAYLLLCLGSLIFTIQYIRRRQARIRLLFWLIASYAAYLPFVLWWDPTEPYWFVILNFFFWGIVAIVWGIPGKDRAFYSLPLLALIILIIGFANFSQTIWPKHTQPNDMLQRAACVSAHLKPQDLLLETDWDWPGYVSYFYKQSVTSLIWHPDSSESIMEAIRREVTATQQVNGQVVMIDLNSYSPEYLAWLETNTSLGPEQFDRLLLTPMFVCDNIQFFSVDGVE
jgi:hypothetical protein